MDLIDQANNIKDFIIESRHYLHSHAELPYEEKETTHFLVSQLKDMGIPVITFEDYTGCIAVIEGEKPGKTLLLRADIDALPIEEKSGVDFSSIHPGVMHACGHDCHAAMLLGAAKLLWENRSSLCGKVKLLFQAAEEAFFGSHYYVDKGWTADVDAAMGMHVWPAAKEGQIAVLDGPVMAGCDNFVLTVKGKSAHGSLPNEGRDAIVAASAIICSLQTVVSRANSPLDPLVVTVGKIRSGTQFNIISDTAVMEGTVRSYGKKSRAVAQETIQRIAQSTAEAFGCSAQLDYQYVEPSVCNNTEWLNEIGRKAAREVFGADGLADVRPSMGGEDFSYIMDHVPASLFVLLGVYNPQTGCTCPVHNEKFKVNDEALPAGAAYYAQFALDYLMSQEGGEEA